MIKTIAFDADDTLWVNETIFTSTREKIESLLVEYNFTESLEEVLYQTEIKNLKFFGYGIKGFILSTIETCIEITNGKISSQTIYEIVELGKEMLLHPVELLPHVEDTINALKDEYQLMIITKGDLFDQEAKIARSGIADEFDIIEVVSDKKISNYQDVLSKYNINPGEFLMIGNSLKSDIIPVYEIGGKAIHIPFHVTWAHENVSSERLNGYSFPSLNSMEGVIPYLKNNL